MKPPPHVCILGRVSRRLWEKWEEWLPYLIDDAGRRQCPDCKRPVTAEDTENVYEMELVHLPVDTDVVTRVESTERRQPR